MSGGRGGDPFEIDGSASEIACIQHMFEGHAQMPRDRAKVGRSRRVPPELWVEDRSQDRPNRGFRAVG
jgi:hypothetical protein